MVQLNRAVLLQDVWGVEAGGGGGGVCGGECVIMLAPPLTDVSLCFTHNTSRRLGSKFSQSPPRPRSFWKDLMMNNKATGLHIYHPLQLLQTSQPRIKLWRHRGWKLKQTAVKAAGFRSWTRVRSLSFLQTSRAGGWGGDRQTDSRSQTPPESGRDADAALLFWEADSTENSVHRGGNGGGGGGSGTSRTEWLQLRQGCGTSLKKLRNKKQH